MKLPQTTPPHPFHMVGIKKAIDFLSTPESLCNFTLFDNFCLYYNALQCFTSHLELLRNNSYHIFAYILIFADIIKMIWSSFNREVIYGL